MGNRAAGHRAQRRARDASERADERAGSATGCSSTATAARWSLPRRLRQARLPSVGCPSSILLDDEVPPDFGRSDARSWTELLATPPNQLPGLAPDQPTVLMYTSGTTGTPKGVPLSHAQPVRQSARARGGATWRTRSTGCCCRCPCITPIRLTVGLLAPLAIGAAVVLPAGITGPQIMRALQDQRCTIMIAVPRLYEAMLAGIERQIAGAPRMLGGALRGLLDFAVWVRRRLGRRIGKALFFPLHRRIGPALRLLASGGARLDPEVAWRLEGLGWEVLTGYGLTETAPILTFNPPGRARIDKRRPAARGSRAAPRPRRGCRSRAMARSWPRARTCSPAIWTIPRPRRRRSPRTASFAPAISAACDDAGYLLHRRPKQGADHSLRRREHLPRRCREGLRHGRTGARSRGAGARQPAGRPVRARPGSAARKFAGRAAAAFPPRGRAALAAAAVVRPHRRFRDHAAAAAADADRQAAPARAARDLRPGEVGRGPAGAAGGGDRR